MKKFYPGVLISLSLLALAACEAVPAIDPSQQRSGQTDSVIPTVGSGEPSIENDAASGEGSPSASVSVSKDVASDKQDNAVKPFQGLTAAAFSDALNLNSFLTYLQTSAAVRIKLPDASPFTYTMDEAALKALIPAKTTAAAQKLDVALVLDVTGSMGDELRYLQKEWLAIASDLKIVYPSLDLRMSLVAYRDAGDAFVTAGADFTSDQAAYQAELVKYYAAGGGDYPEAVDKAFEKANGLAWNAEAKKLMFWLADAPPHEDKEAESMEEILKLKAKGVIMYPIAASGVDPKAELLMRIGALLTGGQYLFLTDDSGIGDSHAAPHVPCYSVEPLNTLLLRVISDEISGTVTETKAENLLRTVGKGSKGVCEISEVLENTPAPTIPSPM